MGETGEAISSSAVQVLEKPSVQKEQPEFVPEPKNDFASRLKELREKSQKTAQELSNQFYQSNSTKVEVSKTTNDEQRKLNLLKRIRKLLGREETKREDKEVTKQETTSSPTQQEILFTKVAQEVQSIIAHYEMLAQEILEDGTIPKDIITKYIQLIIKPELGEKTKNPQEAKKKEEFFFKVLNNYIDHRDEPEPKKEQYLRNLKDTSMYNNVSWLLGPIIQNWDNEIIKVFVARIAAEEISSIKKSVESRLLGDNYWDLKNKLTNLIYTEIYPNPSYSWKDTMTFKGQVYQEFEGYEMGIRVHKDITFWQAVKNSSKVNELFSDEVQKQDRKHYDTLLNESLDPVGTGAINKLRYYPTPDAIRNLVLLAGESFPSERSREAGNTLRYLSEKAEWKNILDKADNVYPELKTFRVVLETIGSLRDDEYGYYDEIHESIQDFALLTYTNETIDPKLKKIAAQALSIESILQIITKRGLIRNIDIEIFKEASTLIQGSIRFELRKMLFELMQAEKEKEAKKEWDARLEKIRKFEILAKTMINNQANPQALDYLQSNLVLQKLHDLSLESKNIEIFLKAYQTIPSLTNNYGVLSEFCKQFVDQETIQFFSNMCNTYDTLTYQLVQTLQAVGESKLTKQRALELPIIASDVVSSNFFDLALIFPDTFLATDQDIQFFRDMTANYSNRQDIATAARSLKDNHISRELALAFPKVASALMVEKMRETRDFILNNSNTLLKDISDIKFLNTLVGEFGNKSYQVIRDYQKCLTDSVISTKEKELFLEFAKQFRAISPTTIKGYKEAKQRGYEKVYVAQLKSLAEKMTGSSLITDEERNRPYYKDLLRHVYPNNSGNWTNYENNDTCTDRNKDIAGFKIEPRYEIDLLTQSEIRIKEGESPDDSVKDEVQRPILEVADKLNQLGHDKNKINEAFNEEIDRTLKEILEKGGIEGLDVNSLSSPDEKLFLILTDSIYGTRSTNPNTIKRLFITYEFANFEDISDYITGTRDRVSRANNQDYALLCEIGAFYSDRIKEVNRRLVEMAWRNPAISNLMPHYFRKLSQDAQLAQQNDLINRLRIDKLGPSETFLKQAARILEKRRGRKYELDEVREIIGRYEGITKGLQKQASTSSNPQTRAFYGQLRSQREKTLEALRIINGEEIDPKNIHLGEIDLQQVLKTEKDIKEGRYDEDEFASYTTQRLIDIFEEERDKITAELSKFESISGKQREVLYAYITKSKESANARMVGGVCVAGDNPAKSLDKNMWDMPNYLQLVFQESDTLQCQGVILLHHFRQDGKGVLAASLNPSSTYLYSVDESALFKGIMTILEQFADKNVFDMIVFSKNKSIRTNRTGGEFERSLDERIAKVDKTFKFDSPQQFSYNPNYQLQDMDVVWEKKT